MAALLVPATHPGDRFPDVLGDAALVAGVAALLALPSGAAAEVLAVRLAEVARSVVGAPALLAVRLLALPGLPAVGLLPVLAMVHLAALVAVLAALLCLPTVLVCLLVGLAPLVGLAVLLARPTVLLGAAVLLAVLVAAHPGNRVLDPVGDALVAALLAPAAVSLLPALAVVLAVGLAERAATAGGVSVLV